MKIISLRTFAVMVHDAVVVIGAFYLSVAMIYGEAVPAPFVQFWPTVQFFTLFFIVQFSTLYFSGVYRAMLRFSSIPDLMRITRGSSLAVPLSFFFAYLLNGLQGIPRTSFILDWFFLILGLNAGRLLYRMMKDRAIQKLKQITHESYQRTFILGAGVAGERLLREISFDTSLALKVVGFVDDAPSKIGKSIRGIEVFGPFEQLPQLVSAYDVKQLIIAMPSASQEQIRHVTQLCRNLDTEVQIKILPRIADVLEGKQTVKALRNIEPEDLLGRKAHDLDIRQMSVMLKDKAILVTGAGGSIGSELCKQIAKFQPKSLILFEMTELFLYELEMSLKEQFPQLKIIPVIGDVRYRQKLSYVFQTYQPEVVFHAAAYKHVPLMESNPVEAIRTNVLGTFNVASMAAKYHADRFVLISSDKAINPTNIMGATKRIAEMVCLHLQPEANTKFMIVRFGNVLGSSGSVIPLFKKQIEKGGPVTVTHPEMRRYFMSIPEATQLVIQAGSLGKGGEVMVLDMGEPMRITDLANEMIALAGHTPGVDIKIEYTGLRPGEKLFEELFHDGETILPTMHPMVKIAQTQMPAKTFKEQLDFLVSIADEVPESKIKELIKNLVPEYTYNVQYVDRATWQQKRTSH